MSTNRQVKAAEERANRSIAQYRAASTVTRGIYQGRKGTWRSKPDSVVSASLKKAAKDVQRRERIKGRLR